MPRQCVVCFCGQARACTRAAHNSESRGPTWSSEHRCPSLLTHSASVASVVRAAPSVIVLFLFKKKEKGRPPVSTGRTPGAPPAAARPHGQVNSDGPKPSACWLASCSTPAGLTAGLSCSLPANQWALTYGPLGSSRIKGIKHKKNLKHTSRARVPAPVHHASLPRIWPPHLAQHTPKHPKAPLPALLPPPPARALCFLCLSVRAPTETALGKGPAPPEPAHHFPYHHKQPWRLHPCPSSPASPSTRQRPAG